MLWNGSLVMIDRETQSLWSHILGEAKDGPLKGSQLETIPSVLTDWKTWQALHPRTTACLLPRSARHHRRLDDGRTRLLVIGLAEDDVAKCWTFAAMLERPVINDDFGKRKVLVTFDAQSGTAILYDRRVEARDLSFDRSGDGMIDRVTRSEWDPLRGVATRGALKGKRLIQLPGIVSYLNKWMIFHPDGDVLDADLEELTSP